jgi:hypothetical protein
MTHFRITGSCIRTTDGEARRIYNEQVELGHHTVLVGRREQDNSMPERRMSSCDVLITVHHKDGPLSIETLPL